MKQVNWDETNGLCFFPQRNKFFRMMSRARLGGMSKWSIFSLEYKFSRFDVFIHHSPEKLPIEAVVACQRDFKHEPRVLKSRKLLSALPRCSCFFDESGTFTTRTRAKTPNEKGDSLGGTRDQAYEISESPQ